MFGPVVILGTPKVNNLLLARTGGVVDYAKHGLPLSESFQWYRDGEPIKGATEQRYTVQDKDAGKEITVEYFFRVGSGRYSVSSEPEIIFEVRQDTLKVLYWYLLEREPDRSGIVFWANYMAKLENKGWSRAKALREVIRAFTTSDSYKKEVN